MKRHFLIGALLLVLSGAALAHPWFDPQHEGRSYVNEHLTPDRLQNGPFKPAWNGQLVLWEGEISDHLQSGPKNRFKLHCGRQVVDVQCPLPVLTLNVNRSGYRAAVKGEVRLVAGRFQGLTGRSVILLAPRKPWTRSAAVARALEHLAPAAKEQPMASFLAWWVGFHCPSYTGEQAARIGLALVREADRNSVDPLLFAALVQVESAFRTDAVSSTGALGLGQLMPSTAEGLGVDPRNPEQNLAGAAKMLAGLLADFPGSADPRPLALASYNAGPNLVRSLGAVPAIPQTTNYVYFIGYLHRHLTRMARAQGALP